MATREASPADVERVVRRLRDDYCFYPRHALRIVNAEGDVVPFVLKPPQVRLAKGLMEQRDAGLPQRAIILKARKVGFSTQAQGLAIQRSTQRANHYGLIVAQDVPTAGEIFGIGRFMWSHLPEQIRPTISHQRDSKGGYKFMQFGEPALLSRRAGALGLNSTLEISTAKVVDAGRGLTIRTLHLSEVAFWPDSGKKLALLNAVPDVGDTLIIEESTANGLNHFRDDWLAAENGESGYLPIFTPWFEEALYRRPFLGELDAERFEATLCTGAYGEDEDELLELIPRRRREWEEEWSGTEWELPALTDDELRLHVLECLNWRRWAIAAKCSRDVEKFHQEYPSTPEEAFLSTGRKVFRPELVRPVLRRVEETDPVAATVEKPGPARGAFLPDGKPRVVRSHRGVTIEVPTAAVWTPRSKLPEGVRGRWEVWQAPDPGGLDELAGKKRPPGQYIVACDPMSGEEDEEGTLANHAIEVIDHRTLQQVAQYESQDDPDQVALELLLVALVYNRAWIAVETTGGWGNSIVQRLARDYRYPYVYQRDVPDKRMVSRSERLGWSTDAATKPMLIDRATELLRDGKDGIRSRRLAMQLLSYIRDQRGRTKPEPGSLADLLMCWMIAQKVAELRPLRPDVPRATSTATHTVQSSKTGW